MLAWLVPGAGHWYLGLRARGIIIFVTVAVLFWSGVAFGGLRTTVDPQGNTHWFLGEICTGGNAIVALAINRGMSWQGDEGRSWGKGRDIGLVYAGVAGLLNLLCIFDAIVRSITGQVREPAPKKEGEGGAPSDGPAA